MSLSKAREEAQAAATGERVRLDEQITRMRTMLDALVIGLRTDTPITESAVAVANSAVTLATTAARLDAYDRVARGMR